jgi:hypothetical protein
MAAFWSLFVKHAHKQDEKSHAQFNEQLDALLARTLQILSQFNARHLATTVLSLVKVMKKAETYGLNAPADNLHRVLHDLIVGINLEKKQYILDTVAESSVLMQDIYRISFMRSALQDIHPSWNAVVQSWTFLLIKLFLCYSVSSFQKTYPLCYGRMQKMKRQTRCYSRQQATLSWVWMI